ncbi:MAG: hypothetical protein HY667_01265 [Chloroflexi bacterium]|nr:hypothetical protein [Chloroflexota bacterium]
MKKKLLLSLVLLFWIAFGGFPTFGQQAPISVKSVTIKNQFPEGVLFQVATETAAPAQIREIRLEMRLKGSPRGSYAYLEFTPATTIEGKYLLKTSGAQFKPVGALIEYYFIITDSEKRVLETPKETHLYLDNRFEWSKAADGLVEVYYYGPVKSRAEFILKASAETIKRMGSIIGVQPAQPVRIIAYNNPRDMLPALPFQSTTTQRELLVEGQAWHEFGILLMLASDPQADGVASHEMTHMLVGEATKDAAVNVPAWLNEGLAEYGNINPGTSYDAVLSESIAANQLPPLRGMQAIPGIPRAVILFYGQSRAVVKYLVETYGENKVKELFSAFNKGLRIDDVLKTVYGFDQDALDNNWRKSLGLPPVEPAPQVTPLPTPRTTTPKQPKPTSPATRRPAFGCAGPVSP